MEKITKTYVEKIYAGVLFSESLVEEVAKRDPLKIENDGEMQGFRFYDKEFIIDDGETFDGKKTNYSNWIYFGKRYSFDEIKAKYGNDPDYRILISNMENNDYDYVCHTQVGSFLPMKDGDMTIDEYIAKHNREKNAIKMFENLKKHIGEKVSYKAWFYGAERNETDTLRNVNYFINIETEKAGIPFVGYGAAISSITLEETGEVLYYNPYIENGYDRRDDDDIEDSKRKIFGDVVVDKQRERRLKDEEERKRAKERADLEAKKAKYILMREGIDLVKPETVAEWLQFADKNTNDGYSVYVVKATIAMMKKMDSGVPFKKAEEQVFWDELGLSGFLAGSAANAISYFAKQGEEFRKYWNKQYGVGDSEEKGTIDSPVYTTKRK